MSRSATSQPEDAGQEFFSEFLARAGVERNLFRVQMAAMLGVSRTTFRKYLTGEYLPRGAPTMREAPQETLARFADVLGYPLEYVTACWQYSSDGRPRRRLAVCQRGHDVPADSPKGKCPTCAEVSLARNRQRRAELHCTACGRLGVQAHGLCGPCDYHTRTYGDPVPRSHSQTGFWGVFYEAGRKHPWFASITHDGQDVRLGRYATAEEAAHAYDAKALELRGPGARVNFPGRTPEPGDIKARIGKRAYSQWVYAEQPEGSETFGAFLARARLERDLTWVELANRTGVGEPALGKYMRGESLPRIGSGPSVIVPYGKLERFAAALSYPIEYVVSCWRRSLEVNGGR